MVLGKNGPGLVRAVRLSMSGTSAGPSGTASSSGLAARAVATSWTPSPSQSSSQPGGAVPGPESWPGNAAVSPGRMRGAAAAQSGASGSSGNAQTGLTSAG